jgi:predicted O-methyltransferase YrrM
MRALVQRTLGCMGFELCRFNEREREDPASRAFKYKDYQLCKGVASPGQISIEGARFLSELVRSSDSARPIIEIGTLFGWSTLVMVLAKPRDQKLITVDNYSWNPLGMTPEAHYAATRERLREAIEHHNVSQVHSDCKSFYATYEGPAPALFFCDADHSFQAVLGDLQWARRVGSAIICGDDFWPGAANDVVRAVNEMGGPRRVVGGLFVL